MIIFSHKNILIIRQIEESISENQRLFLSAVSSEADPSAATFRLLSSEEEFSRQYNADRNSTDLMQNSHSH